MHNKIKVNQVLASLKRDHFAKDLDKAIDALEMLQATLKDRINLLSDPQLPMTVNLTKEYNKGLRDEVTSMWIKLTGVRMHPSILNGEGYRGERP